jgi:hypothetical protein
MEDIISWRKHSCVRHSYTTSAARNAAISASE